MHDQPLDMLPEYQTESLPIRRLRVCSSGYGQYTDLAREAYRICRQVRPDVLLSFPFGWHSFMGYGARAAGVKRIVTHAGCYPPADRRSACRKLAITVQLGVPLGARIVCCSRYVEEGVRRHLRVPRKLLRTVYNGINLAEFQRAGFRRVKSPNGSVLRCGMVGRLDFTKDHETLIRAAGLLRARGLPFHLELAGEGSNREKFTQMLLAEQSGSSVSLLGSRRDIPALLAGWDLFIYSVKPGEGLGVALIEAMAAGVPVIASDVGACREVLCPEGEDPLGELVPAGSPEAIADAVERFVRDREAWEARAARARESAERRFSIEAMAEGYLQVMGLA